MLKAPPIEPDCRWNERSFLSSRLMLLSSLYDRLSVFESVEEDGVKVIRCLYVVWPMRHSFALPDPRNSHRDRSHFSRVSTQVRLCLSILSGM